MVRHLKVCYSINNDRLCLPMFSTKNVVRRDCLLSLIFITNSLEIGAYAQLYFSTFINDSTFITKLMIILCNYLLENMVDGMALLCLTERALEILMPIVGHRMKFIKFLEELKESNDTTKEADLFDNTVLENMEEVVMVFEDETDVQCTSSSVPPLYEECDKNENKNESGYVIFYVHV